MLSLLIIGLENLTPSEILAIDPSFIPATGLNNSLTPSRVNGFMNIFLNMKAQANSFKNPSVEKFDAMIEKSIKDLLQDGQLDQCPLTLDDLRKIKGSVDGKDGLIPVLPKFFSASIKASFIKNLSLE